MSIMSMMKTLDLFAKERRVVMREQMRRSYSPIEYLLAKVVAEMPLDSLFSLTFAAMLKCLTGLRTSLRTLAGTFCLMVSEIQSSFALMSRTYRSSRRCLQFHSGLQVRLLNTRAE